ncbi:MAG TPA: thiamine-phosphate kinase [Gemmatimonadota bacterium]|nr:thiamine-phosphate kinase [Gemmatimonadota bacterium]
MTAAPRGEFGWIARLIAVLAESGAEGAAAIGDDAAIVQELAGPPTVWTIDTLVEGVHFRFDWLDPEAVGRRALAASLSDLAAMGAEPLGALVAAAGPAGVVGARIEGVYRGIAALAGAAGCPILGGDLARAEGPLHLTVTALGRCADGPPLTRHGARVGDEVWVTGELGGPAAALALLGAEGTAPGVRAHAAYERLARPWPRNREIAWLRARAQIDAAIDLSDGLSGDARHVAVRSGVRIVLEAERLPLHPGAVDAARRRGEDPFEWALHGGDELEILLISPAGALGSHAEAFAETFNVPLTRIGTVGEGSGVDLVRAGAAAPLRSRAWDHFAGD